MISLDTCPVIQHGSPQMTVTKCALSFRVPGKKGPCRRSFQDPCDDSRGYFRRCRQENMNMVFHYFKSDSFISMFQTQCLDCFFQCLTNGSTQNFSAVFGRPYKMIVKAINRCSCSKILFSYYYGIYYIKNCQSLRGEGVRVSPP
jgi:hypothetical protein